MIVLGEAVGKSTNDASGPDSRGPDGESISISVFIRGKSGLSGVSRSIYTLKYVPSSPFFQINRRHLPQICSL